MFLSIHFWKGKERKWRRSCFQKGCYLFHLCKGSKEIAVHPCMQSLWQEGILIPQRLQLLQQGVGERKKCLKKLNLQVLFWVCFFIFFLNVFQRGNFFRFRCHFPLKLWKDLRTPELAIPRQSCKCVEGKSLKRSSQFTN